ncbi:hypothetical protein OKC48_16035 [Methylorubrum extorquens]|nr:hypothetical protein [Methylorubrum extorquens]UYW24784.1 hypothetical protein OKC48_16035 [Methylorubrum extorquens]
MNPAIKITNFIALPLLAVLAELADDDSRPKDPLRDTEVPHRINLE